MITYSTHTHKPFVSHSVKPEFIFYPLFFCLSQPHPFLPHALPDFGHNCPSLPSNASFSQHVFHPSEWRSPASLRTCNGSWSGESSSQTWPSMPGILGRSWGGRMQLCSVPSAPTSDSCCWGPKPGEAVS